MKDSLAATDGTAAAASDLICGKPAGAQTPAGDLRVQNVLSRKIGLALDRQVGNHRSQCSQHVDQHHEGPRRPTTMEANPAATPARDAGVALATLSFKSTAGSTRLITPLATRSLDRLLGSVTKATTH